MALVSALTPWKQRKLSNGLSYYTGAGLPNGCVPGLDGCPIVMLRLDNSLAHLANAIRERARQYLGCHVVYGAVGKWFTNAILERYFRTFENAGFRRLPGSMGSGPQDPMRAANPAQEAAKHGIDWQFLEDRIEVELTGENRRKSHVRSGMTPPEIMRNQIEDGTWMPRLPPPYSGAAPRIGWEVELVRVGGSQKPDQVQRPYIDGYGRRHTAANLRDRFDLIGACVVQRAIRLSDSKIEASFTNGEPLVNLQRTGRRRDVPVPLKWLKENYNTKGEADVPEEQAYEEFEQELQDQAAQDAMARPSAISEAGTRLAEARSRARKAAAAAAADADGPPTPARPAPPAKGQSGRDRPPRASSSPPLPAPPAPPPPPKPGPLLLPGQTAPDFSLLRSGRR